MDETIQNHLTALRMKYLQVHWEEVFANAKKQQPSYHKFLTDILEKEYLQKKETARLARIKKAAIPLPLVMETFPFDKQPRLKKKLVLDLYDSLRFITQKQELVLVGPTGCGKTGLATAFLIHAIDQGYSGLFIDFRRLIQKLYQAKGDHTEAKLLKSYQSLDLLLIDELGYAPLEKEQAGLFFDLMKARHGKTTTILTSQLGFDEWETFLQNKHLTAALLDRITVQCTVFNMKQCISIRPKNIVYATMKEEKS